MAKKQKEYCWYEAQYHIVLSDGKFDRRTMIFKRAKTDEEVVKMAKKGIAQNKKALKAKDVFLINLVEMKTRNIFWPKSG